MNKRTLSVATITWARDEHEETVLRESLVHLAALDIPVFVTDGGSGTSFQHFVRSFPHFTLLEGSGVWQQASSSLLKAFESGSEFIFYTEPDKGEFFSMSLPAMISDILPAENTGVIIASRSALALTTFPAFQQLTEAAINNCCTEVIGGDFDYTYGPFLLNRRLVPYLQYIQKDVGWGWRPFLFATASRLNYRVDAYTGNFRCPAIQQGDNASERMYRMKQLIQNIDGLLLARSTQLL